MISIQGVYSKVFVLDLVNDNDGTYTIRGNDSIEIEEGICTIEELKYIETSFKTKRVSMSEGDFSKVVARIATLSNSSSGGAVSSVNGEIGDVVIDASEIELTNGSSIEAKFGELNPVAFSGNYLDLSNRPAGTGEPFTVIDWNPYNEGLVDIQPVAANSSTSYSNGTMSAVVPPSLVAELKDIGYPQSPEIILTQGSNGIPLNLNITPSSSGISKVFTIEDFSSLKIQPLDVFPYDGNTHGAGFQFIIIQLEENETMSALTIQDMLNKEARIEGYINKLYQNESNEYTVAQVSVEGISNLNIPIKPYGNYNKLNLNIVNNELFIGVDNAPINLIDYGFDANKKFSALVMVMVGGNSFDVATPFNIALSAISNPPILNCEVPTILDISVHKDEKLIFMFSDLPMSGNPNNIMQLFVAESSGYLAYMVMVDGVGAGPTMISSEYVDSDGYINYKFNGTEFSLKNNNTLDYDIIVTFPSNVFNYFNIQESDSLFGNSISKTSWSFTINSMQKSMVMDGILPSNSIDGSTLRVTHDGFFNNTPLIVGDIVNPYDNKTKIILHRNGSEVSYFANEDSSLNVVSGKLHIAVSSVGDNILQKTPDGLYVPPPPTVPPPETIAYNLQSSTLTSNNGSTLSVKRSTNSGNSLEFRSDGLYVPSAAPPELDTIIPVIETGRALSGYAVYNALTSDTIYFASSKANVKIENPAASSVQINTSSNGISAVLKNIVKLGATREAVSYSMGSGSRFLNLTNFNIFVIDCSGGSGSVLVSSLNGLDGDQAKTITIIVKNTTALTWSHEFAWIDNIPPTLQPSTTLVVTGIYASNASNATYTAGKILCTFSYFTV